MRLNTPLFFSRSESQSGLVLTQHRRFLRSKWIWLGAIAALLIFLPNLLWLVKHDFPFLELMRNIRESGRDVARGPIAFIADQALIMNPLLFPLWVGGLFWLFFGRVKNKSDGEGLNVDRVIEVGRYRILGWAYVVMLATFIVLKGKNYYLAPAYPMLFAAGAVAFERLTTRRGTEGRGQLGRLVPLNRYPVPRSLRPAYVALIILAGAALAPFRVPSSRPKLHSLSKSARH